MIIKLLGGFLLVLCGGMLGLGCLKEIKRQRFAIEEMDRCLALMESEISLCERPLPEIFEKLALICTKSCRSVFSEMSQACLEKSAAEAWRRGVAKLELGDEAENALLSLSDVLGFTEGRRQSAEIENTRKRLSPLMEKLRHRIEEKGKCYPLLGACFAGIAALMII